MGFIPVKLKQIIKFIKAKVHYCQKKVIHCNELETSEQNFQVEFGCHLYFPQNKPLLGCPAINDRSWLDISSQCIGNIYIVE